MDIRVITKKKQDTALFIFDLLKGAKKAFP